MTIGAGLDNKVYLNSGSHNSPTWGAMNAFESLSLSITKNKGAVKSRNSIFEKNVEGLISFELKGSYARDVDPTTYATLKAAAMSRGSVLDIAVASGAIATTGTVYTRGDFYAFGDDHKEDLEDTPMDDFTFSLAATANDPTVVTV